MSFIETRNHRDMADLLKRAVEALHVGPVITTNPTDWPGETEFMIYVKDSDSEERVYKIQVQDRTED